MAKYVSTSSTVSAKGYEAKKDEKKAKWVNKKWGKVGDIIGAILNKAKFVSTSSTVSAIQAQDGERGMPSGVAADIASPFALRGPAALHDFLNFNPRIFTTPQALEEIIM